MERQVEESFKPRFIRQLHNISITEGDDAFLDCIIVAVPEPKVQTTCAHNNTYEQLTVSRRHYQLTAL